MLNMGSPDMLVPRAKTLPCYSDVGLRWLLSLQHNPSILSTVCQQVGSSEFREAAGGKGVRQLLVTC